MTRGEAVNWIINIAYDIGKAEHRELWHYEQALSEIRDMLQSEPERKTGKWIMGKCDQCGAHAPLWPMASTYYESDYCPNCGSEMRGAE